MEINIKDYLSEEEIKDIIIKELRTKTKNDIERILTNMEYSLATGIANEMLNEQDKLTIRDKVEKAIDNIATYTVVYSDCYRESSLAYKLMEQSVVKNKDKIESRVIDLIDRLDDYQIFDILKSSYNK